MPKKKGEPGTPVTHPDPKVWKWCKHPKCQKEVRKIKGWDDPEQSQKLMREYYWRSALFGVDFCWNHLEAKDEYKTRLEGWVREGYSLADANLSRSKLAGINLYNANLKGVNFEESNLGKANLRFADLTGAKLISCKLKGANFANAILEGAELMASECQGTIFVAANLRNADLEGAKLHKADLDYAEFQDAHLEKVNFQEADCTRVNFSGADLTDAKFEEAELGGVIWGDARYLMWENVKIVGNEKRRRWSAAWSAYLRLKNYFHQQGKYSEESKAYYREKLMSKHEAFWLCFKGMPQAEEEIIRGQWKRFFPHLWEKIKQFFRWLGLWIFHVFTGFGERWWWTVLWALGFITLFAVIYGIGHATGAFLFEFKHTMIPSIFQYFYLSVVTFATLGFGDITPLNWQAQIPVVIEVIMGYVFLGLIITIIARRFGR